MRCEQCLLDNHDWLKACSRCGAPLLPPDLADERARPQPSSRPSRETFLARSLRIFRDRVRQGFDHARTRQQQQARVLDDLLQGIVEWEREHSLRIFLILAGVFWLASLSWGLMRWSQPGGKGAVDLAAVLLGGVPCAVLGVVVMPVLVLWAATAFLFGIYLVAKAVTLLAVGLWTALYALWRLGGVLGSLLALIPLSAFVVSTRALQLWKGIFYTCPSRPCGYRGLPIYLCPQCNHGNRSLWPNLYGLLWHRCTGCGRSLPSLDLLGRGKLPRRCGGCEVRLLGKHAGRARERLVAIVGSPGSGKTSYLLMTVGQIVQQRRRSSAPIGGEIDDDAQAEELRREWGKLAAGKTVAKTVEVASAFLLYARVGKTRCQLYLYDAPGEELSSIAAMVRQRYFPMLEGLILLVDPTSFAAVREDLGVGAYEAPPLAAAVAPPLAAALAGFPVGRGGKLQPRLALVLAKADLEPVRREIGDIRTGAVPGERCREAIVRWGGGSAVRAIEHHFEQVGYFACSMLGRQPGQERGKPFQGFGTLAPLAWILTGERSIK